MLFLLFTPNAMNSTRKNLNTYKFLLFTFILFSDRKKKKTALLPALPIPKKQNSISLLPIRYSKNYSFAGAERPCIFHEVRNR